MVRVLRYEDQKYTGRCTDLETLALSQNKRFWRMFDTAYERAKREGWIDLKDLD
jgi:hypothetical protein